MFSHNTDETGNESVPWAKKDRNFDVTMGAPDGAEVCELVGLFLLQSLNVLLPNLNIGLYRDDGLAVHGRIPGPQLDAIRKSIHDFFGQHGLRVTVEINKTSVDFLDVTFDLKAECFAPFKKPNDQPLYVHKDSNHPDTVKRGIPRSVNKRLNTISSTKESFDRAKGEYQKALQESGYNFKLEFEQQNNPPNARNKEKKKRRDIIWFNPPFNQMVKTNLGKKFLALLDYHFPPNHKLRKCLNRNCVKLSYSCTSNMRQIILSHNNTLVKASNNRAEEPCNCRGVCALGGRCNAGPIVYKVTVNEENVSPQKTYIGSTQDFKSRLANHKASFRHEHLKNATALSAYVWEKDLGPNPNLSWTILAKARTYDKGGKMCNLCLTEKLFILKNQNTPGSLNKRTELAFRCAHIMKHRLSRVKENNT